MGNNTASQIYEGTAQVGRVGSMIGAIIATVFGGIAVIVGIIMCITSSSSNSNDSNSNNTDDGGNTNTTSPGQVQVYIGIALIIAGVLAAGISWLVYALTSKSKMLASVVGAGDLAGTAIDVAREL